MKHFTDEDWLDFVRGALPGSDRAAMRQHLESGCRECALLRSSWEKIIETAHRDRGYGVLPETLQAAEAAFEAWRKSFILPARARRARLFFDSLLQPLPTGVRHGAEPARRMQHRLGQWTVDLNLESEPGNRLAVTGQVLKPGWQPSENGKTGVLLLTRERIVSETEANSFGEFQFTCDWGPELTLIVELPGEYPIAVALPGPGQPLAIAEDRSGADTTREDRPEREERK